MPGLRPGGGDRTFVNPEGEGATVRHVAEVVGFPRPAFADREDAGRKLADYLQGEGACVGLVVAVPSGGVPVGRMVAERFGAPLGIELVRKLPLPHAPEMGFGAVTLEGETVINDRVATTYGISDERAKATVEEVLEGLREREKAFHDVRLHVDVEARDVVLVDDGLATGVTMQAAVGQMRSRGAATVAVAVPDSPERTLGHIEPLTDQVYCLFAQSGGSFAVASFYRHWHDLTDDEVIAELRQFVEQHSD